MDRIAELIKECIIDKKPVKEEVNRFRSKFQQVHYSYDEINQEKPRPGKLKELENQLIKMGHRLAQIETDLKNISNEQLPC